MRLDGAAATTDLNVIASSRIDAFANGVASVTADELIAFCRERMARFKAPRHVVFTELPKTSTGKIQKFVLREMAKSV